MAATHFYVYYRITADSPAARRTIATLIAEVEARTGIAGRLLARSDDKATWMEVYGPVSRAASFRRTLDRLAKELGATAFACDGKRHVEAFGPLPARARR